MVAFYPPMGWNSWDCYGAAVDEKTVKQNADYMAKHLKKYGWEYIVVDIEWYQPSNIQDCSRRKTASRRRLMARDLLRWRSTFIHWVLSSAYIS